MLRLSLLLLLAACGGGEALTDCPSPGLGVPECPYAKCVDFIPTCTGHEMWCSVNGLTDNMFRCWCASQPLVMQFVRDAPGAEILTGGVIYKIDRADPTLLWASNCH